MTNRDWREALRGEEVQTFDLLAQVLTSRQWAGLLKAPLQHAARHGNRGLAQKLVGAGAEMGDALHAAARGGHEDIVNNLLENGASVAAKDTNGDSPLHCAAQEGKTEMMQLLLLKGADKDALDNKKHTPLHLAVSLDNAAAALALLAAGADVSLRCGLHSKKPAMHLVVECGNIDILNALAEYGADVDAVDRNQETALHHAAPYDREEAIVALVEAGANIEARDRHGFTPLHVAAVYPNLKTLVALLKHGADVNAQDKYQQTPLHLAASLAGLPSANLVDSLLRSGADETILNHEGKAAADVVAGRMGEGNVPVPEDVEDVRELLATAPADRAWRHRGYLVLCRAHPDRMQLIQHISSAHAGVAQRTRSRAKLGGIETGSCKGTAGDSMVDGRTGGSWAGLVARVLVLQEEGIFQTIVGYL